MKNRPLFIALLLLITCSVFAQRTMVSEEAAIKKVIEDETMYFMQRDYDKWAECVAHDPMTYYTWTTPFAGENDVFEARGWDEVSKEFKKYMSENPPNDDLPKKENYKFKVNGNMAFVTFSQNYSEETRVLEKTDGKWRILRMEALASKGFEKMHDLYSLQRMAGNWEIDMSTYKKEGGGSWKMLGGSLEMERTPTGIVAHEKYDFKNKKGEHRTSEELGVMSYNMNTGKVGLLSSVHYPNSNWTAAYSAVGAFNDDGQLICKGEEVGGKDEADVKFWWEDDLLCWSVNVRNEKGEEVYASSYKMRRAGSVASASTP